MHGWTETVEKSLRLIISIFLGFLKVGATAFGGPAMIPYVRRLAIARGWISEGEFRTGVAICQMIPGATVMQLAAYVGFKRMGIIGALAAFIGFGLPAFVMLVILTALYIQTRSTFWVEQLFGGLKLIVVALVLHGALDFSKRYMTAIPDKLLALLSGIAFFMKVSPPIILLLAAFSGIVLFKDTSEEKSTVVRSHSQQHIFQASIATVVWFSLWFLIFKTSPKLASLAITMAKIDILAFGGGYAALPLFLDVITRKGWLDTATLLDGIALGQLTPGPIVITSVFIGFHQHGLAGAIIAAFGTFSPSFFLLIWAAIFSHLWLHHPVAHRVFRASIATLGGLMASMAAILIVKNHWDPAGAMLTLLSFVALRSSINTFPVVLGGSVLWIIWLWLSKTAGWQ
ncbi:MAG: chromate efflux transporter [Thermodesulforhabdaceae bacterium]|jgi:chromate transporter